MHDLLITAISLPIKKCHDVLPSLDKSSIMINQYAHLADNNVPNRVIGSS